MVFMNDMVKIMILPASQFHIFQTYTENYENWQMFLGPLWISRKPSFGFLIFINWKWVAVLKLFSNLSIFPLKIMGRKESKGIYHLILIIKILKSMTFRKVNELATWSWTPMTQSLDIWTVTLSNLTKYSLLHALNMLWAINFIHALLRNH